MSPEPVVFTLAVPEPAGGRPKDAWADLDMQAIRDAIAKEGFWAPGAPEQAADLKKLVAEAKADGHQLSVVVLDQTYGTFTVYRDIATELQAEVGGTVLVFSPGGIGTASDEFSRVQLEDATEEIGKGASASQAAAQLYGKAIDPNVDWTGVTIGLIVVVVIGAVIARFVAARRGPVQNTTDDAADGAAEAGDAADAVDDTGTDRR